MLDRDTPRVDHLCILALALEWIVFGSCHFTFRAQTEAEILSLIPAKTFIVIVSGMIEVVVGILILLPKTRKWAALTSVLLLFLFIPSIYKMLADDSAIYGSQAWRDFVRVLLVPNHVFLAFCGGHVWYSNEAQAISTAQVFEGLLSYRRRPVTHAGTPVVATVMLFANLAGFFVMWRSPWNHSPASLWALMCLAIGGLVGFLFGVPRVNIEANKAATLRPNSNIEVVSDWVTKIIVGVGLVEFRKIGDFLARISAELSQSFVPQAGATSFAKALIVYFFVAGAIQGYLLTRMYLATEFRDSP